MTFSIPYINEKLHSWPDSLKKNRNNHDRQANESGKVGVAYCNGTSHGNGNDNDIENENDIGHNIDNDDS